MSLLDRYLNAVRAHLPAAEQDDIITELGDDIRAQFEEREAALGRPLTEDEEAALLKPFGRPLLMAARYRPRQFLIGPALFPYYWTALKLSASVALIVIVAVAVAFSISGRPLDDTLRLLWKAPIDAAFQIFTWVTLVFALIEVGAGRVETWSEWDPRTLPQVVVSAGKPASRVEVGLDLVFTAVFLAFWVAWPRWDFVRTLADSGIEMAPAWSAFHLPVLLLVLASMAVKAVVLVRPDWTRLRLLAGVAGTVALLIVLSLLLRVGDLVVPSGSAAGEARALVRVVNVGLRLSFVAAIVISTISTVADVWRYVRSNRRSAFQHPA
jgi:hypothetical protein